MPLTQDIIIDDSAFETASQSMDTLKNRTEELKTMLGEMYDNLSTALDTPAGKAIELKAKDVLIEPIENLRLVIDHISSTLTIIKGSGHYKDVFVKFEELSNSIQF